MIHCTACRYFSPRVYPVRNEVKGVWQVVRWDHHCGYYDRRFLLLFGCRNFSGQGVDLIPHPLEH